MFAYGAFAGIVQDHHETTYQLPYHLAGEMCVVTGKIKMNESTESESG